MTPPHIMARRALLMKAGALGLGAWPVRRGLAAVKARVGVVLPFTGAQAEIAHDLQQGYTCAFKQAAGVGHQIEPLWEDDQGDAERTAKWVSKWARDPSVLATSGIVGTPHALLAIPEAVRAGLPVVGIRSGATALRTGTPGVFHLRASFEEEIALILKHIQGTGLNRLSVVYPQDAFGVEAVQHLRSSAERLGLVVAVALPCDRGGADVHAAVEEAVHLGQRVSSLVMLTLPDVTQTAVIHARTRCSYVNPVFCMSFCATRGLAEAKHPALEGLALASPFPLPWSSEAPLVTRFRHMIKEAGQAPLLNSMAALEGFIYGSTLAATLAQSVDMGRAALQSTLRRPIDLGGLKIQFDARNVGYRYLQMVYKSRSGGLRV